MQSITPGTDEKAAMTHNLCVPAAEVGEGKTGRITRSLSQVSSKLSMSLSLPQNDAVAKTACFLGGEKKNSCQD